MGSPAERFAEYRQKVIDLRREVAETIAGSDELVAEQVAEWGKYKDAAHVLGCRPIDVSAAMTRNWQRANGYRSP